MRRERERSAVVLSAKDTKTLREVGPGAPLGKMMRRYWQPIALSSQVAEPDGKPLRQRLLGENFVVFRDTSGKVGVLNEACPHRGASLALGRNEDGGLRCLYHGWKHAVDGTVLETPNAGQRFCDRIRVRKYPAREQSGLIWTFIGPEDRCPPFRTFEFDNVPDTHRVTLRANTKASYLPLYEGGCDISHQHVLHTNGTRPSWGEHARGENVEVVPMIDPNDIEIQDTDTGFISVNVNAKAQQGKFAAAFNVAMPNVRVIPFLVGAYVAAIEVPMDDFETATYLMTYSHTTPLDHKSVNDTIMGFVPPFFDPATCDMDISWANDMGQDRESMKTSFTGYAPPGIEIEDVAMAMSIPRDWDLSKEQLCKKDSTIIRLRNLLLKSIKLNEAGEDPPGLNKADMSDLVSFRTHHDRSKNWQDYAADFRRVHAEEGMVSDKGHSDFAKMGADGVPIGGKQARDKEPAVE